MEVVVLDRFNGNADPEDWISRAERYFTFLGFSEEYWLPLSSLYLDGEALEWFRWLFRNNQFFDWNHFKEKLALRFQKGTYTESSGVDAQITSILALLQKIEDKYAFTSQQVVVENTGICTPTVFSGEMASPLIEENSSPVDYIEGHPELLDTSIPDHSGHVDYVFDEMSNGVFTNEVAETSPASIVVADLNHIQSPKEFDKCFHSYCPIVVAKVQPDTPFKMLDEQASDPKHSEVQLLDEGSPKDMSKRYVTAKSLDRGLSKQKIEFETFDDKSLAEFLVEPKTIEKLYLNDFFMESEDSSPRSNLPSDGLLVVEHGKFSDEFSARNILCQFLFNHGDIAAIHGTATYLCIWDPGISFKFKALIGTVNTKPPLLLGSTAVTSLNFNSRDTFAKWAIAYKMVVMELKVDDTCAEVNRVFEDSSQRVSSREIQSIAPLDIICLPKLIRFLQQLLAQLIFVLQAPKSKVRYAAIRGDVCSQKKIVEHAISAYLACLQGCIKTMVDSIEQELCNFSTLEEIMVFFGAQGASIVDAYVVHKSMLEKSKSNSILSSWGKFITTTRLMCYLAHFGGHRLVEERTVAQQIQLAELRKTSGATMRRPLFASSQALLAIILQQKHHYLSLLCETPMEVNEKCRLRDPESFSYLQQSYCYEIVACITSAHDSVNIKEVLKIAWLGKREQMKLFRVVAFVMILALYTHLSLGRFNIILSVWLYSNLEDKVLIEDESIVMNQV
ncbi:hypothetical protein KY290_026048 [Solanum tuberosum]|uniref:Uncharacterized protein n=1 Tax=Solanum tuberosum TaxID=4113 RepID=A0ABQ7UVD5_SOLTU|nr:hypothetical protein KY289_025153 [Solanum tuberosum]KAH0674845.1 hypothetical protein KY284_025932 [Solanum tuberosum]KAH0677113.1 hypothetical protein KY285_024914 [Solanum tuberosum]KAH0755778.1 hypothetical protein KY290_026048 [Solanum tuberosum]